MTDTAPAPVTPETQLSAVTRTVTPTADGFIVSLAQTFAVDAEDIWSALTIGEHLASWFGRASGDAVEGGRYELPDMETRGTVLAIDAPHRLLLSWEVGRSASTLELLVTPEEGERTRTRFELRHTVPDDAHWEAFGPSATGCGWDAALYALALHLEDPEAHLMRRLGEFAGSAAGAAFTRATADAWFEAHVATGADKKPARKASVRAAAFYLGEETDLS
ncbi:SRPBCC domain-containing protein [Brachybacterium sp. UNK5269]|uniref:SRPBCC domain-containing protein n=1 Tax=Brachybacterium sp. UNK5269 TaxID=3408576 RepID=UPI003BB1F90E